MFCSDLNYITKKFDDKIMIRYCNKFKMSKICQEIINEEFGEIDFNLSSESKYMIVYKSDNEIFSLVDPITKNVKLKTKAISKVKSLSDRPEFEDFSRSISKGKKLNNDQLILSFHEDIDKLRCEMAKIQDINEDLNEEKLKKLEEDLEVMYFNTDEEPHYKHPDFDLYQDMSYKIKCMGEIPNEPRYFYKYSKYLRPETDFDVLNKIYEGDYELNVNYPNKDLLDEITYIAHDGFERVKKFINDEKNRNKIEPIEVSVKTYKEILMQKDHIVKSMEENKEKNKNILRLNMKMERKTDEYIRLESKLREIEEDRLQKFKMLKSRSRRKNNKHISNYAFERISEKYPITLANKFESLRDVIVEESDYDPYDTDDEYEGLGLDFFDDQSDFSFQGKKKKKTAKQKNDIIPDMTDYEMAFNCLIQTENIQEVFCDVKKRVNQRAFKRQNDSDDTYKIVNHAPEMKGRNYFGLMARIFQMMRRKITCTSISKEYKIKGRNLKYAYGNISRLKNQIDLQLLHFSHFKDLIES